MVTTQLDESGKPSVWCDPCLVPLIRALNDGGIATAASCCGHNGKGSDGEQIDAPGWVMLHDGRTLTIHAADAVLPVAENWNPNTAVPDCDWCGECDWCDNLGRGVA